MKTTVSPDQYRAASATIAKLAPALNEVKKIQAVNLDAEISGKVQEFARFVGGVVAKNQEIVDQGDAQYEARDKDLINRAGFRLNRIPELIAREEKALKHKQEAREIQADELKKKHFTAVQIDVITPPVSQAEIDESNAVVAYLKAEAEAIQRFFADRPRYDIGLLSGTSLDPLNA